MVSMEQMLIMIRARDETAGAFKQLEGNTKGLATQFRQMGMASAAGFMQVNQAINDTMSPFMNGKSPLDFVSSTASKAESNKVLLSTMADTKEAAESMYTTIDKVTDNSLVSMQDMIPAMKAFKASAGATDEQMTAVADQVANFGSAVLATTGSTELANTAMFKLSHGIQGAFAALDQYGITEESLKATGLWSGRKDDVEGFMAAVTQVTGDTKELMNTNSGLDAQIQKAFSRGAKRIGEDFLPQIKGVKQAFLDLDAASNGDLSAGLLTLMAVSDGMGQLLWRFSMISNGFNDIYKTGRFVINSFKNMNGPVGKLTSSMSKLRDSFSIGDAIRDAVARLKEFITTSSAAKSAAEGVSEAQAHASALGSQAAVEVEAEVPSKTKKSKQTPIDNKKFAKDNEDLIRTGQQRQQMGGGVVVPDIDDQIKQQQQTRDKVKQFKDGLDETSDVLDDVDKSSSKVSKSGKNIGRASAGLSSISAGFMSMITPLITIGAVIAVAIPIIAGLAAEALIFAAGVAQLIKRLGFENLDLSGATKGIKSFGQAMWELAGAMTGMGITAATSAIVSFFNIFGVGVKSIRDGANELKQVAPIINDLAGIGTIDPTVVQKLKDLGTAMKGVSDALKGLGDTSWSIWTGGLLDKIIGSPIEKLSEAHDTLYVAAKELNYFNDLPPVSSTTAQTLQSIGTAIKGISDALGSLGDINWDMSIGKLFGSFKPTVLRQAFLILYQTAQQLQLFQYLPDITPIGDRITKIANALKPIKAGIKAVADIGNVDVPDSSVTYHIAIIRQRLKGAADQVNLVQNLPDVADVGPKIVPIVNALKPFPDAAVALTAIQDSYVPPSSITYTLQQLRQRLKGVADQINLVQQLPDITPIGYKIRNIVDGLKQFPQAANAMGAVNGLVVPPSSITYTIQQLRQRLAGVAREINLVQNLADVTPVGGKITPIIDGLKPLTSANQILTIVNALYVPPASVAVTVQQIRQRLGGVARELNLIQNIEKVHGAVDPVNRVVTGLKPLTTAAHAMIGVPNVGPDAVQRVSRAVSAVKGIAEELKKLTDAKVGDLSSVISSVKSGLDGVKSAISSATVSVVAPARNLGATIASGVKYGLSPLHGVVSERISSAMQGAYGPAASGGRTAGTYATDGFKFKLDFHSAANAEMDAAIAAIRNKTSSLVSAARDAGSSASNAFESEGLGRASPGKMAKAMTAEMLDTAVSVESGRGRIIRSVRKVGDSIARAWKAPKLTVDMDLQGNTSMPRIMNDLSKSSRAMKLTRPGGGAPIHNDNSTATHNIAIHEGAIKLDARNLTTKESKQVMINALEGLDVLRNPQIKGM